MDRKVNGLAGNVKNRDGVMEKSIRFATVNDLSVILEIFNEVIANTTAIYQNELMTWQQIVNWFGNKQSHSWPILVVEQEGRAVGFATYGPFRERECYQSTVELAVHISKENRGKGSGTQLLNALIQNAKENQFHVIMAGIDSENISSIRLHEKLGFKVCGELRQVACKFDRWLDLTLMQLLL